MGDGNLHPTFLTDEKNKDEMHRVEEAFKEIFNEAIRLGGTITGEHGVGVAKKSFLPKFAGHAQMRVMRQIETGAGSEWDSEPGKNVRLKWEARTFRISTIRWCSSACIAVCACRPARLTTQRNSNVNSPRGRIALMRAIADGQLEATKTFGEEMYYCLGCLACMTACPAGVELCRAFRARPRGSRDQRRVAFNQKEHHSLAGHSLAVRQRQSSTGAWPACCGFTSSLGFQTMVRSSGLLRLLPKRLRELEAITPEIQAGVFCGTDSLPSPLPRAEKRYRVAMLTGCAQDLIFSDVNQDTVEVLARNGCEVITPAEQHCCGSLHAHNGEWELAQQLARKQIDQFPPDQFDAIISNAGGCGSHLKHFHKLLSDDPAYQQRAKLWDQKVKDIHEWLDEIGIRAASHSQHGAGRGHVP